MIIAICGTPGTGKTVVAKKLAKDIGYEYISLNQIVVDNNLGEKDESRNTLAVDLDNLKEFVDNMDLQDVVIDGIISYAVSNDVCIVLRCEPKELRKRLIVKNWPKQKVDENVESEIVAGVVVEALEHSDKVFEIDTTTHLIKNVVKLCGHIAATRDVEYEAGKIDWME